MSAVDEEWIAQRARILKSTIEQLGLRIEGTYLEHIVARLYGELEAAGLRFRPKVYLADEWACPDGVPVIGIPFYLADEKLARIEDEMMEGIEASSEEQILSYLRHEAGHAFNYAYKLFERPRWQEVFGEYGAPYRDDFVPQPFSHSYVRHIPGFYAQKHPDEDFAESFAVWLNPRSRWREIYGEWAAYSKLLYVDELMLEIGEQRPAVSGEDYDFTSDAIVGSLDEHYRRTRPSVIALPAELDHELSELFHAGSRPERAIPARAFIEQRRRELVSSVAHWTGLYDVLVRSLVRHFAERSEQLGLWLDEREEEHALIGLVALTTALSMNKIYKNSFVLT